MKYYNSLRSLFITAASVAIIFSGSQATAVMASYSVAVVPIPAALPLLVSGLFGLGFIARLRNNKFA